MPAQELRPLVDAASALAVKLGRPRPDVAHLLAAILLGDPLPAVLLEAGLPADELRRHLRDAVLAAVPDADQAAWDDLLGTAELGGGIARELVDPSEGLPLTADRLGVGTYASMLATVVARRNTALPLSIGLFGEWGSGKSFFMGLVRGQVQALAGSDPAYHEDIVQIGFNAWHYADTNLWASLGNTIFARLAGPEETLEVRRDEVARELGEKSKRRQELEVATASAQAETVRLRGEIADRRQAAQGSLRTVARVTAPALRSVWARLGVADPVEQGALLAAEVAGVRTELRTWRRVVAGRRGVALAALAVLAVLLAVGALVDWDAAARWLAGVLGTVAVAVGVLTNGVRQVGRALRDLTAAAGAVQDDAVRAPLERLRAAEAEELVLRAQLGEVVQQVGELGRELAELSPGQRLYSFIGERAASQDYRGRLGLVSTVRHDFGELATLMERWRADRARGGTAPRPVDRIVLYIDDLDRCSPRQVVDVLEAVHLLLALDLFVVVLGVDPRVLHRSLERELSGTLGGSNGSATSTDYLEKIINIPFALPSFGPDGFGALIDDLSTSDTADGDTADGGPAGAGPDRVADPVVAPGAGSRTPRTPTPGSPGSDGAEPAALAPEAGSEVAESRTPRPVRRPVPRGLAEEERRMLAAVGSLVRSPRQGRRLLNIYRMVRSTRYLGPASRFLGSHGRPGDHQAVVVLLALLTACPDLLPELLAELAGRPAGDRWADVVGTLGTRPGWVDVVDRLAPATALVTLPDLAAFRAWGPHVTRFSFLLSGVGSRP